MAGSTEYSNSERVKLYRDIVHALDLVHNYNFDFNYNKYTNKKALKIELIKSINDKISDCRLDYSAYKFDYYECENYMFEKYGKDMRLRYGPVVKDFYQCAFPEFCYQINVYLMMLSDQRRAFVVSECNRWQLNIVSNQNDFIDIAKRVSTFYKRMGVDESEFWMLMVDVHVLSGVVIQTDDVFTEKIKSWVSAEGKVLPSLFSSHNKYIELMNYELHVLLKGIGDMGGNFSDDMCLSMEEMISQPERWITNGTSTVNKQGGWHGLVHDKSWFAEHKISVTKAAVALFGSHDKLLHALRHSEKGFNAYGAQKEELGKPREIVTGDDISYFIMRYLFEPFIRCCVRSKKEWCYVYLNNEQRRQLDIDVLKWVRTNNAPPADADLFDKYQSKELILSICNIVCEWIHSRIEDHTLKEEYKFYWDRMNELWPNSSVFVTSTGAEFKWMCGVLSGWYITILLDSIISYLYSQIGIGLMQAKLGPMIGERVISQGDDLLPMIVDEKRVVWFLIFMIDVLKIKFNPSKFWTESGRSEFLRKVYLKDGYAVGYPVRVIPRIVFKKDSSTNEAFNMRGEETGVLSEIIAKYDRCLSRGMDDEKVKLLMVYECKKFLNTFSTEVVESPVSVGGMSWLVEDIEIHNEYSVLQDKEVRYEQHEVSIDKDSPAYQEIIVARSLGVNVDKQLIGTITVNGASNTVRRRQGIDRIKVNIMASKEDNYPQGESNIPLILYKEYIRENSPRSEFVREYGPNIASELLKREMKMDGIDTHPLTTKLKWVCGKQGYELLEKMLNTGMTWFGGPEVYSTEKMHAYICGKAIAVLKRKKYQLHITELRVILTRILYDNRRMIAEIKYLMYK